MGCWPIFPPSGGIFSHFSPAPPRTSWSWARRCTGAGDPYWCISEEIPLSLDSKGILYMQFDVAMSPCEMAKRLQVKQIGTFEDLSDKYISFEKLDECNRNKKLRCLWYHWDIKNNNTRNRIMKTLDAMEKIKSSLSIADHSVFQKLRSGTWRAVSDFLYIPRKAFESYAAFVTWEANLAKCSLTQKTP